MTLPQIEKTLLALPPQQRARLVDLLLLSLHGPASPEIEKAWADEAERRIEAFNRGQMKGLPADEVLASLRRKKGRKCG